jgi:hypothetical protein
MFSIVREFAIVGVFLGLSGASWQLRAAVPEEPVREKAKVGGDYEGGPLERLSSPREVPSEIVISEEPYFFQPPTRINRYEVWQFYEVGRYGRFRPRVIYSPYGSFYLYDGQPYPWVSTHQLDFMPRLIGP